MSTEPTSEFGMTVFAAGDAEETAEASAAMFSGNIKGLEVAASDGRLRILREGTEQKVVPKVEHLSFSGTHSGRRGTKVLYVTVRAVFEMRDGRLTLAELAPGIDLERQVLAQLAAPVDVAPDLKTMDARIFIDAPMFAART